LKVHSVRSGNSDRIEDSSIIILEDHWAPGKILDYFYEDLKPADIDYITEYGSKTSSSSYSDDGDNHTLLRDNLEGGNSVLGNGFESIFSLAEINGHHFGSNFTDLDLYYILLL